MGNVLSQGQTFYVDTHPYTQVKTFDNSPFKQSLEQYGVGQAWQTANPDTKYTKVLHDVATENEVRWYEIDGSKNIIKNGFYPAHSLTKTTTIDEQEHQTITYTNQGGTLIQKSVQDDTGFLTTYYVLDDLGRIGAVIQPKGFELNQSIIYNSAEFEGFVFFYEYNDYNQLVRKHIPSGGWSSMVYDKANRVVLEQDAHQATLNKWNFMVYDVLGRLTASGELNNNDSRETLQNTFDSTPAPYASFPVSYNETDVKYGNLYDNYDWIAGEWAFNGSVAYNADNYWSNAKGLQTGAFSRSNEDNTKVFHTVMHYDKKGRIMQTYQVHHKGGVLAFQKPIITNYEYNFAGEVTKEKVLYQIDGLADTEAITAHEYDHTGRILKVFHGIDTTLTEIIKMDYDELGRLLQKKFLPNGTYIAGGVKEYINRPNPDGIVTQNNTQDVARKAIVLAPTNSIDAINLTTYSARIDPNATGGTSISGLQTMNYRWHIRGGLLGINLDNSGNATPKASEGDLFSYKLEYETAGLYDGNIGKQSWQTTDNKNTTLGVRAYTYTYDVSSRLKSASFSGLNGENFSLPNLSYDKNGNIQNLQRKGKKGNAYDDIDNLSYNYTGNKLTSVTDGITGNYEVDFVPRGSGAYTYYPNGALKSDDNEQITNIIYDTFLKQPIEVVLSDGRKIKHFYDGLGRLFKTVYYSDATTVLETWDFIGGLILKSGTPPNVQFYQMATPEGRAIFVNNAWQYEFDYKDHLGNTRVSFKANGNNVEKNAETAFDPFGVRLPIGVNNAFQNRFEMQGKESEKTFGLNRINFGARTVNPTIGRFDRVDALANLAHSSSVFAYCDNNPINAVDPDGKKVIYVNGHWNSFLSGFGIAPFNGGKNHYWNYFSPQFIPAVRDFFKVNEFEKDFFIDGSSIYGGDQDGEDRYKLGREYAQEHYNELISGMKAGESIKIVSHSEGGAFAAGIASYLKEVNENMGGGYYPKVETLLYLSPDEVEDFKSPKGIKSYQLHYENDPVSPAKKLNGVEYFTKLKGESMLSSHGATVTKDAINKLNRLINEFTKLPNVEKVETESGTSYRLKN